MQKDFVVRNVNQYLEFVRTNRLTTTITVKLDIKNGGIGRCRAFMEHNLDEFISDYNGNGHSRNGKEKKTNHS